MSFRSLFIAYVLIHLLHQSPALAQLFQGSTKSTATVEQLVQSLQPGDVLILGEMHDQAKHHLNHEDILNEMHAQGVSFDVGMEFFYDWRNQPYVDQYLRGELDDDSFLKNIQWGGDNFGFYKTKVLWPLEVGGWTYAINAPKALTKAIAKDGFENLSPELAALLPPNFEMGNRSYFDRFKQAVGGDHFPPDQLMNYFSAQSVWDDTMAWKVIEKQQASTSDVFVVIVGDFHVAYGGGLPDRLSQRGSGRIVTLSQIDVTDLTPEQKSQMLEPHEQWGQRADWIWMTEE